VALLDALIVAGVDTPNNPELVRFLAAHYLISHFLVLDMIETRQKYNPVAETSEEVEKNKQGMVEGYKKNRNFIHDDVLPWLIQAESRILERLHPTLSQSQAETEALNALG
jgi:hypothetical protein